jgi:hypothetical protein
VKVSCKINLYHDNVNLIPYRTEKLKRACQRTTIRRLKKARLSKEAVKSNMRIPQSFYCPITMELMKDPVMASDGHVYERSAIEEWFRHRNTSPLTNLRIADKKLISCHAIRSAIDELNSHSNAN